MTEPITKSLADDLIARAGRREMLFGIMGLGYVGLPLAVELAHAGYRVLGFDVNAGWWKGSMQGRSHVKDVTEAQLRAGHGVRPIQRDDRHVPARRAGRDLDLRAHAALEVQGPGRQLHRGGHRGGEEAAPPGPGDRAGEHHLSRHHP